MAKVSTSISPKQEPKVMFCNCQHIQQDGIYGEGKRLHNKSGKKEAKFPYRCTVCGIGK